MYKITRNFTSVNKIEGNFLSYETVWNEFSCKITAYIGRQ